MNKSKIKMLLGLLSVLIVACVVTVLVKNHEEKKEQIKNTDEVILSVDTESVTKLSWKYDDASLSFTKNEDTWNYDNDEAFPVDTEKIENLLSDFSELGAAFIIEDVEDYDQYGLEDPTCTIDITAGENTYEIKLGAFSTLDEQRYVSTGDGNVYLVSDDPFEDYEVELKDMILDDVIPNVTDIKSMTVSGEEDLTITYDETEDLSVCADDVYYTDGKSLDTDTVASYLSNVTYLSRGDYLTYKATDSDISKYGLDDPTVSLTIDYIETLEDESTTEGEFTLSISCDEDELKKAKESDDESLYDEVECYARIGESPIVYSISYDDYDTLTKVTYNDLRHKDIMTASTDDIYEIDVTLEDKEYQFFSSETAEKNEDSSEEKTWMYGTDDDVDMSGILSAITSLKADEFISNVSKDKEEISFTVKLQNETYPELTISLYRHDGDTCVAEVSGEVIGLIPRSQVVDLIEEVNSIILN